MGDGTGIEWTDETWNPIRGCRRTAPTGSTQSGCGDATGGGCYAEAQAERIVRMGKGKPTAYDGLVRLVGGKPRWTGEVSFDSERLAAPLRWRKGRRIFVNSMSDLFYERFSNEQIAAVFGVMAACPQHTFQILTKRARRMREWFEWVGSHPDEGPRSNGAAMFCARRAFDQLEWDPRLPPVDDPSVWPLRNAWIGVSVENQAAAIERIPDLLLTPAAVRFLSCEPLLGPVDLSQWTAGPEPRFPGDDDGDRVCRVCGLAWPDVRETLEPHACPPGFGALHWIIAGCESGPGARPCEVTWLRSMRDQCERAGVAFFLKQARDEVEVCDEGCGQPVRATVEDARTATYGCGCTEEGATVGSPVGIQAGDGSHRKPGGIIGAPYLDRVQHLAFPEVHRG